MTELPFLVLKIGGSLFSRKGMRRHIDGAAVRKFAHLIAPLAQHAPGRLALVVGGGSFGHGAVRKGDPADPLGMLGLTEANFTQKWIWTRALRSEGARVAPFQLMAMCALEGDALVVNGEVLRRALSVGIVPVLSGDCLVGNDGALHVFGSDRVPQVLIHCVPPPVRVVTLTDTPGILRFAGDARPIAHVDSDAPDTAYGSLWTAPAHDTTRGMAGKLEALLDAARQGAECFVLRGHTEMSTLMFLFERLEDWPVDTPHTRIGNK